MSFRHYAHIAPEVAENLDYRTKYITTHEHIPVLLEMHYSVWTEEFRKYKVRDLLVDGRIYKNPDILNCSDYIKDCIRNWYYQVNVRTLEALIKTGTMMKGYIAVIDGPEGMEIGTTWEQFRQ